MAKSKPKIGASLKPAPVKVATHSIQPFSQPSTLAQSNYPWDSFQDIIIVNSIEFPIRNRRVGVDHYQHQLATQKTYPRICWDPDEYRRNGVPAADLPHFDSDAANEEKRRPWRPTLGIDYAHAPTALGNREGYGAMMYRGTTMNPAVLLAIVRLAQRNLPFMDFESAVDHLPNHPPEKPLPQLVPGLFAEDIPHEEREGDVELTVLFLPYFYTDGRHALGYYHNVPTQPHSSLSKTVKSIMFTPCTRRELAIFGLVEYFGGDDSAGLDGIESIGTRAGMWMGPNIIEDWEDWNEGFMVAKYIWQKKLLLCQGATEDSGS